MNHVGNVKISDFMNNGVVGVNVRILNVRLTRTKMIRTTERFEHESKWDYLTRLVNCFGATDLAVCYNYEKDGEKFFSKWLKVLDLWHLSENELIPDYPFLETRLGFILKVTHRTVLDCEIMFDIDDLSFMNEGMYEQLFDEYEHFPMFNNIFNKKKYIMKQLQVPCSVYWTGNKSYHISVLNMALRGLVPHERCKLKRDVLMLYGCDLQKSSERSMIALEDEKHYRSGLNKQVSGNSLFEFMYDV
jgi:hypothetical protein